MPLSTNLFLNRRFLLVLAGFVAAWCFPVAVSAQVSGSGINRIVIISVDGLRPDLIQQSDPGEFPGFERLMAQGAFTFNARVDPDISVTLPNHVSMLTGRFVGGPDGHDWFSNVNPSPGETIHAAKGSYVQSIFDVVHDRGGRTAVFATKTKFALFDQSYDAVSGAVDLTGSDEGRDKIDAFVFRQSSSSLVDTFRTYTEANGFQMALLHLADLDTAGHAGGWDSGLTSAYSFAVRLADHLIADVLDFVSSDPGYAGRTTVIVTADHGGTGLEHGLPTVPGNYTIPFFVWGPEVTPGGDLYALNPTRTDPGAGYISRTLSATATPIFNVDAANLALSRLGYPAIAGSTVDAAQDLVVNDDGTPPPTPLPPIAAFSGVPNGLNLALDATASSDPDGSLVLFRWDLGDGTLLEGPNLTHSYAAAGTYTVMLTVTDDQGLTDSASEIFTIDGAVSEQMVVDFQDGVSPTGSYTGTRDTKLRSDAAETAFGDDPLLEADGFPPYRVLLAWDLSAIPPSAAVLSAELTLEVMDVSGDTYGLFGLNRAWSEAEATWLEADAQNSWDLGVSGHDRETDPLATFSPNSLGELAIQLNAAGIAQLQRWVLDPSTNHGFLFDIVGNATDGVDIASRETPDPSSRPRLSVTYSTDPNQAVNLPPTASFNTAPSAPGIGESAVFDGSGSSDIDGTIVAYDWDFGDGTLASGAQASHAFAAVGQYSVSLTVTDDGGASSTTHQLIAVLGDTVTTLAFQDGLSPSLDYLGTRDTKIKSDEPNTAFGDAIGLEADGMPDYGILLQWDITEVPAGATVLSASLSVSVLNPSSNTYEMYEMVRAWSEVQADWTRASIGTSWSAEGAAGVGDRAAPVVGRVQAVTTGRFTFPLNENGLAMVQRWLDLPQENFGLILQDYDGATNGIDFFSREESNAADRPRLEIEYTTQTASPTRLLIISDAGNPVIVQDASTVSTSVDPEVDSLTPVVDQFLHDPRLVDAALESVDREYRVLSGRNSSAVILVPASDSSLVDRSPGAFALDGIHMVGGRARAVYTTTLARGLTSIAVPAGGRLYVPGESPPSSLSTHTTPVPAGAPLGSGLRAYPNPFDSALQVEYPGADAGRVDIIDVLGRTVASVQMSAGRAQVPDGHLVPGTYVLRLHRDGHADESTLVIKAR
jgi:PKD repeat protein